MPTGELTWKKRKDGRTVLTAVRADGTRVWSDLHPFQPLHDMLHYAVESTLGFREAFFGLILTEWTIEDFAAAGAVARMPAEAGWAEAMVGMLDQEREGGRVWSVEEFNEGLSLMTRAQASGPAPSVTAESLRKIRRRFAEIERQWVETPPGGSVRVPIDL